MKSFDQEMQAKKNHKEELELREAAEAARKQDLEEKRKRKQDQDEEKQKIAEEAKRKEAEAKRRQDEEAHLKELADKAIRAAKEKSDLKLKKITLSPFFMLASLFKQAGTTNSSVLPF